MNSQKDQSNSKLILQFKKLFQNSFGNSERLPESNMQELRFIKLTSVTLCYVKTERRSEEDEKEKMHGGRR